MRPKPAILSFRTTPDGLTHDEVVAAPGCWLVLYDGQPCNWRSRKVGALTDYWRYRSCAFQHPGHAHNLAERLNAEHKTDLFTVAEVTAWTPATED